ncbi:RNA polymerase subunit sigma [Paenibacillus phage Ley]|uniref:RNA polymerase subunit sigma n=3 Tax=Halcyonevirus C7Cdelta TaxID=2845733 RepID=A0A345ASN7_9CAUD|nr:sigma factor [Paenibacillus phage C7Cdelta]AXF39841.1 RNA polymerase subunit sigma [Paenibacillus phage C7Cdelta]AXF40008.1 RNA polymerase subunit sigma [Paenibacillus phage Ash]AXF40295.1 RNA polymerase subunit sigma [Paenibacillus phage Ley]
MGHVKIDIQEKDRKYTQTYALNTPKGVARLLRDRYRIAERRFKGDTAASDILIDLSSAIESAGLTQRQAEALALVHGKWQLTQSEAAEVMGVKQQVVSQFLREVYGKLAAIYRKWSYGEIIVEYTESEGERDIER